MSATAASAEPSRATLIKWLRLNLGLTSMIGAGLFTAAGVLIDGTVRVNNYDNRLDAVEAKVDGLAKRLDNIDLLTSQTVDRRVKLANDLASISRSTTNASRSWKTRPGRSPSGASSWPVIWA